MRCGFERQRASAPAHLCDPASRPCVRGEGVFVFAKGTSLLSSSNKTEIFLAGEDLRLLISTGSILNGSALHRVFFAVALDGIDTS